MTDSFESAYHFRLLEPWYSSRNPVAKPFSSLRSIVNELLRDSLQFINGPSHTPPSIVLQLGLAFSVQSKGCIILSLNKPVKAFVAILAPRLHREWLIEVVIMS